MATCSGGQTSGSGVGVYECKTSSGNIPTYLNGASQVTSSCFPAWCCCGVCQDTRPALSAMRSTSLEDASISSTRLSIFSVWAWSNICCHWKILADSSWKRMGQTCMLSLAPFCLGLNITKQYKTFKISTGSSHPCVFCFTLRCPASMCLPLYQTQAAAQSGCHWSSMWR